MAQRARWVIKIGSALLTNDGRGLDLDLMQAWVDRMVVLRERGIDVMVVSSGAVAEPAATAQFLLVPYQGACIHTPAPPPNQVISVYAPGGARLFHNWQPVTVTGVMSVANQTTSLAEAGYVMTLNRIKAYREDAGATTLTFVQAKGAHDSPLLQ